MNIFFFKALRTFFAAVTAILAGCWLLTGCTTRDDRSDCTADMTFRFEYILNKTGIDRFSEQAACVDLFIYNESGSFVKAIRASRADGTLKTDNRITVNLPHGHFTAVVWSNLHCGEYAYKYDCRITEKRVSVNTTDGNIQGVPTPLMHGMSAILVNNKTMEEEILISMMKNTNKVNVILNITGNQNPLTVDDFSIRLSGCNGVYNYDNSLAECSPLQYIENCTVTSPGTYSSEFGMMRMLVGDDTRLSIRRYSTRADEVTLPFETSLTEEILKHPSFNSTADLDREDEFTLMYNVDLSQEGAYVIVLIKINDWTVVNQGGPLG